MESIVQDTPASKSDDIIQEDTCVFLTQQYMPIFHNGMVFPLENADR
jgi:hypothetical protein